MCGACSRIFVQACNILWQEAMYNVDVDIDTALAGVWSSWLPFALASTISCKSLCLAACGSWPPGSKVMILARLPPFS